MPGALFPYDRPRPTLQDFEQIIGLTGAEFEAAKYGETLNIEHKNRLDGWVCRAGNQIEHAVRIISGMFDPELIVLGGALPSAVIQRITDYLAARHIEGPSRGLEVAPVMTTMLGNLSGPIGAASIPFFNRFFPGSTVREHARV